MPNNNRPEYSFTLEWCVDHKRWYVDECPECMAIGVEEQKDAEINKLQERLVEYETEIEELKYRLDTAIEGLQ